MYGGEEIAAAMEHSAINGVSRLAVIIGSTAVSSAAILATAGDACCAR